MYDFKRIIIITGHYGSGKTNIAVNLALYLKKQAENITVIDLDIVNPYFRTADFKELFAENDIALVTPIYANTNLDIPALPAKIDAAIASTKGYIIIDVGGDDAGAIALGRYSKAIAEAGYDMLYVINKCRYLTKTAPEASELLYEIEATSRLKATGIVNNTNLGEMTTAETIQTSNEFTNDVCKETGLPLIFSAVKKEIAQPNDFPVDIFVKSTWQ